MEDFRDRVALVTGGGEGIGRGIAHALAGEGARVAVVDIDLTAARRVAQELTDSGATAAAFQADVSGLQRMQALADEVESALGPVSILCNNAGVMLDGPLLEASMDDWNWVLSVNLLGVVHGVQAFVPRMQAAGLAGHVVNTGSMAGLAPRLGMSLGIYSASKAAVVSYSEMLRAELEPAGIGVSVLCPSTVDTQIWTADRNRQAQFGSGRPVPRPDRVSGAIKGMDVGPLVVEGIRENRAYIFTGTDGRSRTEERQARITADIAAHEARLQAAP